jgi:hypothetical protein
MAGGMEGGQEGAKNYLVSHNKGRVKACDEIVGVVIVD